MSNFRKIRTKYINGFIFQTVAAKVYRMIQTHRHKMHVLKKHQSLVNNCIEQVSTEFLSQALASLRNLTYR